MPLGDFEGQMPGEPCRQLIALPDARRRRKGIQLHAAHAQFFTVEDPPRLTQRRRNTIEQIKVLSAVSRTWAISINPPRRV
nr:Uncharacterised protein [Klebsiella pneumoniae]